MLGFILTGDTQMIKDKIIKKLHLTTDISPEGDLSSIEQDSIQNNNFTFNSLHNRRSEVFKIYHILFDFSKES